MSRVRRWRFPKRRRRRDRNPHEAELDEAAAILATDPDRPDAWCEVAAAAYRLADFERCRAAYERTVELDRDNAGAWHGLGRALMWTGDRARAMEAFTLAARLEPESFIVPIRVAGVEFHRIAGEAWRTIPDNFMSRMANTMVAVEELPDAEDVAAGLDPDVLGIYEGGTALDDGDWFERIVLFQRNHEVVCATLGELEEEVRRTILHEAGHHFGMEHDELPF